MALKLLHHVWPLRATWFHLTIGSPFACPVPPSFKDYTAAAVAIEYVNTDKKTARAKEDWKHYIHQLKNITPNFYEYGATITLLYIGYKQRAKWRYAGLLGATAQQLGNPILFVSQTLATIYPLVAAEDGFSRFEGSGLVKAQGVGHQSFGWPNACALGEIRKYFVTGEVSRERILYLASVLPSETAV